MLQSQFCNDYKLYANLLPNIMEENHLINWYTIAIVMLVMINDGTRVTLVGGSSSMSEVVETVERRSSRDKYVSANGESICFDDNNLTYLIHEDECVNNEELMRGMIFTTCIAAISISASFNATLP